MIGSSNEHLNIYKILYLFNNPVKSRDSLHFATFFMKSISHTSGSFETTLIKLIESFLRAFIKICCFFKCHCHIHKFPSKATSCSILIKFNCNIFWKTNPMDSLGLFSRVCLKIPQVLPAFYKVTYSNTSCIESNTLFGFSTIKNWGISKSD